jgi:hypothetical protein
MGLGQTPIVSVAQVESPDALRNRTFDSRPPLVHLLASITRLPLASLLQRLIFLPWLQLEPTSLTFGLGARRARYTATAILPETTPARLRIQLEKALVDQNIRAIAIGRANLCDADAIEWLLDLGNNWDRTEGFRRRISLILTITSNAEGTEPALVKQLRKRDEIRPYLLPLTLPYITDAEFTSVFALLVRRNLNATFDQSLNDKEQAKIAKHWHETTNGNWYLLREGAMYIDEALGAPTDTKPRRITSDVLNQAEKHFQRS